MSISIMKVQIKTDQQQSDKTEHELPTEIRSKIFGYMLTQTTSLKISNAPQECIYHGAVEFWRAKRSGIAKSKLLEHAVFHIKNKTIFLEALRALLESNAIGIGGITSHDMPNVALRALLESNFIIRGGTDGCKMNSETLRAYLDSNGIHSHDTYSRNIDSSAYTSDTRGYFRHLSQVYVEPFAWTNHAWYAMYPWRGSEHCRRSSLQPLRLDAFLDMVELCPGITSITIDAGELGLFDKKNKPYNQEAGYPPGLPLFIADELTFGQRYGWKRIIDRLVNDVN